METSEIIKRLLIVCLVFGAIVWVVGTFAGKAVVPDMVFYSGFAMFWVGLVGTAILRTS